MRKGPLLRPFSRPGGETIAKIKEKKSVKQKPKQKRQSVPRQFLRRGLDDSTERLRGQLRETSQRGQASDYGGDRIEDSAVAGGRFVRRRIMDLLKRKNSRQTDHPEEPQFEDFVPEQQTDTFSSPPDTVKTDTLRPDTHGGEWPSKIKTREAVSREASVSDHRPSRVDAQRRTYPPQIKTRETVREKECVDRKDTEKFERYHVDRPAERRGLRTFRSRPSETATPRGSPADEPSVHPPDSPATSLERPPRPPDIKTRSVYAKRQALTPERPSTEATVRQGRQEFAQAQGRRVAVKRSEDRRKDTSRREEHHSLQQKPDSSAVPNPSQ